MMPMGYEYGCRTPLDVVGSRPGDWAWQTAAPRLDLTGFVGAVNRMKAATPALNVEGPQQRVTAPNGPVVGLLRLSGGGAQAAHDMPGHAAHAAHMQMAGLVVAPTAEITAVVVHTAAMFLMMGAIAMVVYEKVGLAVLRRAWINLDLLWAVALIVTGVLSLVL